MGNSDYFGDDLEYDDLLPMFSPDDAPQQLAQQYRFRPWMPSVLAGQQQDDGGAPWIFDDSKRSAVRQQQQQKHGEASKQLGFLRAARSSFQACSHRLLGMLEMVCLSRNAKRSGMSGCNKISMSSPEYINRRIYNYHTFY